MRFVVDAPLAPPTRFDDAAKAGKAPNSMNAAPAIISFFITSTFQPSPLNSKRLTAPNVPLNHKAPRRYPRPL
jgi:hypothetical protein